MANNLASVGYVGYGIESVEGTTVTPTIFLPVSAFSFDSTNDYVIPEQLRGSRDRSISMSAPYSTSGTMDMELTPNGIRPLLKSALAHSGTVTPSAYQTSAYQSAFVPGSNDGATFTFESSAADILFMRYGGIRVNTLEISAAFGEIVTASWGLEGTTREKRVTGTTESYDAVLPFHFTGADVKVNDVVVSNIKNFTFNIGNNIERIGTLRKTRNWFRTTYGMRDVGFSAAMDFQDTADYDLFLAETEFEVDIHLAGDFVTGSSGPRNQLRIVIPRVRWNMVNAPISAGEFIEQSVEANIMRPLNGDPIFTLDLINSESTAV
jgi:hypothetical protein